MKVSFLIDPTVLSISACSIVQITREFYSNIDTATNTITTEATRALAADEPLALLLVADAEREKSASNEKAVAVSGAEFCIISTLLVSVPMVAENGLNANGAGSLSGSGSTEMTTVWDRMREENGLRINSFFFANRNKQSEILVNLSKELPSELLRIRTKSKDDHCQCCSEVKVSFITFFCVLDAKCLGHNSRYYYISALTMPLPCLEDRPAG